jgi:hypothetical protein
MAWFIDNNPGACSASCDGRRPNPVPTLIAFETVNNGSGSNPKSGDSVFFYESATVYDGPFVPLSGQRTVGQDATTSFATAMNLTVPDTTVAVPVMNSANGTTTTISAPSSSMTFVLQPDCALIGMTIVASTGNAVWGTSVLGTITISDVQMQASGTADGFRLQSAFSGNIGITGGSITQSGTGFAVVLSSIAVNVSVGSLVDASGGQAVYVSQFAGTVNFNGAVSAHGNATGITVIKNADAAVNFNGPVNLGTVASRLSGGTAVSVDHGNHAGGTTSFSSLTILTNGQQALAATNGGHLTVSGGNIDTLSGRVLNLSGLDVDLSFGSLSSIGSGGGQAVLLSGVSGSLAVAFSTSLSGHPNQGILVTGSTADASFGNTTINGGTDAISLQNNPAGTRSFGSLTIGNAISPSGIGFLHAVGGGNVSVAGPTSITNPLGSSAIDIESATATTSIVFGGTTTVTKNTGTAVALGVPSANNLSGTLGFGTLNVTASNGTALSLGTTPLTAVGGTVSATNGPAILASGTAFNATFGSVSSQGSAGNGISLANATGSLTMIGGSIPSAGGTSFNVSGGTANVTYGGSITQNGAQFAVVVSGSSGGTKIFAGAVTSTGGGKGISLVANPGAAIAFTGTLTLSTGANPAFAASGGGTVTASGAGSTIATTTATAVNIGSTTIGAAGFTVQSVSSSGGSSTGIILDTTGAGAFSVTGSGTTSSGGGIGNKTGADGATSTGVGIYLNATTNPSFAWMQLNDFQNFAILGNNVTGLSLDHVFVSGTNGTLVTGAGEGDVYFTGLAGSASVTGCSFAGAAYDTFHVFNNSGQSLNRLTITGTTFGSMGVSGNNAVYLQATDGTFNVTVQSSSVTSARAYMLQLDLHGAVSSDLLLGGATAGLGNTLANNHSGIVAGKGGVLLSSGGAGENVTLTYNIASNTIRGAVGAALSVVKGAGTGGSFSGAINSNTVGTNGAPGSGSSQGDGIAVFHAQGGTSVTTITNNQVYGSSGTGAASIHVFINDSSGGNGKMTATIQANTVGTIGSASYAGVFAHAGAVAADQHRACFTVGGAGALQNTVNLLGAPTTYGYAMTQAGNTLVYGGGPTTAAGIATLLMANNLYLNAGIGFGTTASASTSYQASCPP